MRSFETYSDPRKDSADQIEKGMEGFFTLEVAEFR
jgi:hypothetical protein